MTSEIAVFIHAANIDGVEKRLDQYVSLLKISGLLEVANQIFICYVGSQFLTWEPPYASIQCLHISDKLEDFELPTQTALWNYARVNQTAKILYLHTKGVGKERNECIEDWICYMTYFCIEQWKSCIELLESNNTVGVDLLQEPVLHYSGNFWWAKASYLSTLPKPTEFANLSVYPNPLNSLRHNQEFWICYKKQNHACLWQSNINCYQRHLHRYPRASYDLKLLEERKQMSKSLCIFFLTGNAREQFLPEIVKNISNCKYKKDIHLLILTDVNDNTAKYHDAMKNTDVNYTVEIFPQDDNYMRKVRYSLEFVEKNNIPYMMKHDNDLFCSSYMYDFLFENKEVLQNETNLLLTPTLTSGIPTVEQFLHDFTTPGERNEMYKLFMEYRFGNTWGVDYSPLNKHTVFASQWNPAEFFQGVKGIQHPYRGVHPVRLYDKAIYRLNELVLKYKDSIMTQRAMTLIYDNFCPYFCNSIYIIRSDIYKKIMNTPELFVDPYDEVAINQYRDKNKMNIVYTQNGASVHVIYNSIPGNDVYERQFMKQYNNASSITSFEEVLHKYEGVDTSKGTDKNTSHSYGAVYSNIFNVYKDKPVELLEIGFDCGASLLAYADYFSKGTIYGLDIQDHRLDSVKQHSRIHTKIQDALVHKNSFQKYFDIIIEDASHELNHQIQHFIDFGNYVRVGGLYIIEDVNGENAEALENAIKPYVKEYGYTLEIKDLRGIKRRFDDILFILKKDM